MIVSAALLMRERGARATTIDDVLAHSGAPRGSVYHHFPGGREELLREATTFASRYVELRLALGDGEDPVAAFDAFVGGYRDELLRTDMRAGCPVVAVAIESRDEGSELQGLAGDAFGRWEEALSDTFQRAGVDKQRADELAVLAITSIEGALILSRAQKTVKPLDSVRAQLRALLQAELRKDP